jgi:hypothetical protein
LSEVISDLRQEGDPGSKSPKARAIVALGFFARSVMDFRAFSSPATKWQNDEAIVFENNEVNSGTETAKLRIF